MTHTMQKNIYVHTLSSDPYFASKIGGPGGFRVPPKLWKLLQIGILRAKDHNKKSPI